MGFELQMVKNFGGGCSMAGKPCDSCDSTAATIFCRSHSAFLCLHCDSKLHSSHHNLLSRHERVWVCEVCEHAPASVTCKADAAALCITCDADIHSANPLASRHERVPVEPFFDSHDSIAKPSASAAVSFLDSAAGVVDCCRSDDAEAGLWLFQNANSSSKLLDGQDLKSGEIFFSEMDSFIDVEYPDLISSNSSGAADHIVPVHSTTLSSTPQLRHPQESSFEIDFSSSKINSFRHPTQSSISQSVSSSSLEVGVVPDRSSVSDISPPFIRNFIIISDPNAKSSAATNKATTASGLDREARVMRYREKRKNRRFEKTIRYASRKAYAETRPRIKGRFAKRKEIEEEEDCIYSPASTAFMADAQYGVVPISEMAKEENPLYSASKFSFYP